ncbi:TIM barrel protein [Mucilaginibacter sp. cycad4]|uniref:sugar phosphate isomerase/epimerase family protein n=1 Tax=Mucilaginibacter sp. cycad4 TaxID=3342096 RepID=UPI002AABA524|nr:TIM barrel protein [Mucilaginibacter gossypii]WPV01933.1 TIM barrel protein [Mucilaginibacter gossypii]
MGFGDTVDRLKYTKPERKYILIDMKRIKSYTIIAILLSSGFLVAWINDYSQVSNKWKLGVEIYTFHRFTLAEGISKSDSAGVHYIEAASFQKIGDEIEKGYISQISEQGLVKLNKYLDKHHIKIRSVYVFGGSSLDSWKNGFLQAKKLKCEFITAEPPRNLWDSIDSLAGVFHIKVAIHNHWKGKSAFWSPDSVLAAIKNHPNFGACPDLGHWPKSGVDAVSGLQKLQGHILAIHLKDASQMNDPNARDVDLGTGVVNFKAVLEELKRQNYKGFIYIERDADVRPSNLPSVIKEISYYNDLLRNL